MHEVDCVIVGAGVVGLAIARKLAQSGCRTLILEAEMQFGTGVSSRNSEVIHAGIYYPSDSVRARLCVQGRDMLYAYCQDRGIPHAAIGKLIVATAPAQVPKLQSLLDQGIANGVDDLRLISGADAMALEPALHAVAAIQSPSTGIIDSHALMLCLLGDAEAAGATLVCRTPLVGISAIEDGFVVATGGHDPMNLSTSMLVNATGLSAWDVASLISPTFLPPRHFAKGNYYTMATGRVPFSRLIYPVPEEGGLGVHLTLDLGGQGRFGPDVEWLPDGGYDFSVDPRRADHFADRIRQYWPSMPASELVPAYCGIRPKLSGPGQPAADFMIQGPEEHGIAGLVNLFGIESPGLTCCLAIATLVTHRLMR